MMATLSSILRAILLCLGFTGQVLATHSAIPTAKLGLSHEFIQGSVLGANGGESCCIASAKIAEGKKDGCTASIMGLVIAAGCTASMMGRGISAGDTASIMGCGIAAGCTALTTLGAPGGIAAGCSSQDESSSSIVLHLQSICQSCAMGSFI